MRKIKLTDSISMAHKWMKNKDRILRFPYLTIEEIRAYQLTTLNSIVSDAIRYVPFYRKTYTKLGIQPGGIKSFADFERLPTISKSDVLENPGEFIDERFKTEDLIISQTSGSSGVFLDVYCDPNMFEVEELQVIRMIKELCPSYSPRDREVLVYTSEYPVTSMLGLYRTYYINNLEKAETIFNFIKKIKPKVVAIYPSILREIVNKFDHEDFSALGIKLILTNSEQSSQLERDAWADRFTCAVMDEFSSEEIQSIAYQCSEKKYHEVSDCSYIEILSRESDRAVNVGEIGEITGTCLINHAMPLIRYRQGDYAKKLDSGCCCGKCTPIIGEPVGRINSSFISPAGNEIPSGRILDWTYSLVLDKHYDIRQFQIIQETVKDVNVKLVAPNLSETDLNDIKCGFKDYLNSEFEVTVTLVDCIERPKYGKFFPISSKVAKKPQPSNLGSGYNL